MYFSSTNDQYEIGLNEARAIRYEDEIYPSSRDRRTSSSNDRTRDSGELAGSGMVKKFGAARKYAALGCMEPRYRCGFIKEPHPKNLDTATAHGP